jgi:hypothetical protein
MAIETIAFTDATGATVQIYADQIAAAYVQMLKLAFGADGVLTPVEAANPLPTTPSSSGDVASTLTDGRQTVATPGTAVALRASLACRWVIVTALRTNTTQVNVGGAGALATAGGSTGTPLLAGESVTIPVDNASKVFVDARTAGEGVSFTVGA